MNETRTRGRIKHPFFCLAAGIIAALGMVICLSSPAAARDNKVDLTDAVKKIPKKPKVYTTGVKRLTIKQCAQCHIGVFTLLQKKGARHQLPCEFCHTKYHTFAPGKVEYKDAIPKCQTCHGQPHGDEADVATCKNCHSNAHSPLVIPDITEDQCVRCHQGPPQEIQKSNTKHTTDVSCTDCHTTHGFIPECVDCHSEDGGSPYHMTDVSSKVCLGCHPVHHPLDITYTTDTPSKYCASCHENPSHERVYNELKAANSKHFNDVTCADCHDQHGKIPECFKCHSGHTTDQTAQDCLKCHKNPHQPLNIVFDGTEPKKWCAPCHQEQYDALIASQTKHTALTCSKCHDKHGKIPPCEQCHGVPHGKSMIEKFKNCADCHGSAHNIQGRIRK